MIINSAIEYLKEEIYIKQLLLRISLLSVRPVLIYQAGKVGSSSIKEMLELQAVPWVLNVHRMNPRHIEEIRAMHKNKRLLRHEKIGKILHRYFVEANIKVNIISMVREPVARNISAFFQNIESFVGQDLMQYSSSEISNIFLEKYPHDTILNWFDVELAEVFGVNVYDYAFPKKKGWLLIKEKKCDLLLLKAEIPDSIKARAVADFLGLEKLFVPRANAGGQKAYGYKYQDFLESIQFSKAYLDRLYESKYASHFYSVNEIEALRSRWSHSMISPS